MRLLHLRNRHFFLIDLLILSVTPALALMLRLDTWRLPQSFWAGLALYTAVALVVRLLVFRRMGLYAHYWRYASVEELLSIVTAVVLSSLILVALWLVARTFLNLAFARSILVLDPLLVLTAVGGVRYSVRYVAQHQAGAPARGIRTLIVGAGNAGEMILRELQKYPQTGMLPVGFVDDDPAKQGMRIHGVPVLGTRKALPQLAHSHSIQRVVVAIPSASGEIVREIVGVCEMLNLETKIVPGFQALLEGKVRASDIRSVDIEDLLRRAPVQTDVMAVRAQIAGKRVLVTGGGGSIGSELCRQLLLCGPRQLIVLGHGENSVFETYNELRRRQIQGPDIVPVIADVRFRDRLHGIFRQYRPEIVFHAAAHKHVPLMERNPGEAITNNVLGTRNLLDVALATGVERFVMISTDKAVNPTSIMGATKRTAELLVHQAAQRSGRPYVAVRFGNVLGSRGSVVLTFKQQIAAGGPVTITHPDMRRYFMTIPEAVQLVLQAGILGSGGEVFVLDMGEPVRIEDLARDLIRLSGYEPGKEIELRYVGLRPGEKLFEELFVPGEAYTRTAHQKIFIAANAGSLVPADLDHVIDALTAAAQRDDAAAVQRVLHNLIPEYEPLAGAQANAVPSPRGAPAPRVAPSARLDNAGDDVSKVGHI